MLDKWWTFCMYYIFKWWMFWCIWSIFQSILGDEFWCIIFLSDGCFAHSFWNIHIHNKCKLHCCWNLLEHQALVTDKHWLMSPNLLVHISACSLSTCMHNTAHISTAFMNFPGHKPWKVDDLTTFQKGNLNEKTYVCMYVCTYVCMHDHVCTCTC